MVCINRIRQESYHRHFFDTTAPRPCFLTETPSAGSAILAASLARSSPGDGGVGGTAAIVRLELRPKSLLVDFPQNRSKATVSRFFHRSR